MTPYRRNILTVVNVEKYIIGTHSVFFTKEINLEKGLSVFHPQSMLLSETRPLQTSTSPHRQEAVVHDEVDGNFSESLSVHFQQKVYTGEVPFICKVYGKSFSQIANLQSHQRGHTEEKKSINLSVIRTSVEIHYFTFT